MCDVSCTSAVLSVETIRTARREEGCGPLGGAANVTSLLGDEYITVIYVDELVD